MDRWPRRSLPLLPLIPVPVLPGIRLHRALHGDGPRADAIQPGSVRMSAEPPPGGHTALSSGRGRKVTLGGWGSIPRLHESCRVLQLSLSRLNHRLPRCQAYPEVMQGTAEFHYQITDPLLPQADPVLHDAAALDTTVNMLDPQPTLVQLLVRHVLLPRELLAAGLLGWHEDLHLGEREGQEAQILQQPTPSREWGGAMRSRSFHKALIIHQFCPTMP